jgi:hypothetical protein
MSDYVTIIKMYVCITFIYSLQNYSRDDLNFFSDEDYILVFNFCFISLIIKAYIPLIIICVSCFILFNLKCFFLLLLKQDIHSFKSIEYIKYNNKFNIAKNENDESANKLTTFKLIT